MQHRLPNGRVYGTRTHTVLLCGRDGRVRVVDEDLEPDGERWVRHDEQLQLAGDPPRDA